MTGPPSSRACVLLSLSLAVLTSDAANGQEVCSHEVPPYDSDWVVRSDQVRIHGIVRRILTTTVTNEAYLGGARRATFHEIEVVRSDGDRSADLLPGTRVMVARWTPPTCRWGPLPVSGDTLPRGSEQLVTGVLREAAEWVEGRPTLDVGPSPAHLIPGTGLLTPELDSVWELFTHVIPEHDEWYRDCRPGVRRVDAWLRRNPNLRSIGTVVPGLRQPCLRLIDDTAELLIRWDPPPLPADFQRILAAHGCEELTAIWHAIPGMFRREGSEWAFACTTGNEWRVLVVSLDEPDDAIELFRRDGKPAGSALASAPPEYFDWMTASDFEAGERPRPAHDLVLLYSPFRSPDGSSVDQPEFAFFWTSDGWARVRPICCRGIEVRFR